MQHTQTLIPHRLDHSGQVQMAETDLASHENTRRTPTDSFFVVHHYDPPPSSAEELGTVDLVGLDGSRAVMDVSEIKSMPSREVEAIIECAGMSRGHLPDKAPGTQFGHGLCGAAKWQGVSLRNLLKAVGPGLDFATLVVYGLDQGWVEPENVFARFGKGLPQDKALHEDTMLAWSMNDEPLSHLHGGPVRLIVPGWFGVWWVKWVQRLELTNKLFNGFWQSTRYVYKGGEFGQPQVVKDLLPRSLILQPADGSYVYGREVRVCGKAWAGERSVSAVEVSADGGRTWIEAELSEQDHRWSWVDWQADVEFAKGVRVNSICVRATDSEGNVQPWESERDSLGYGNNGIMCVTVRLRDG